MAIMRVYRKENRSQSNRPAQPVAMDGQLISEAIQILTSLENKRQSEITEKSNGALITQQSIILNNFDKQCHQNKRAAKFLDQSNSQCFSNKEIKEMHRFFFEKEDQQPFTINSQLEEPNFLMIINELVKSKLPLKRCNRKSQNTIERELLNPFISQNKRARIYENNL